MRIQLTSRGGITTKEGKFKPYKEMDIEFLDLDGDRPKKKHLVSFNFKDFDKIAEAAIGSSWEIATKPAKDPQYVDWLTATPISLESNLAPSKAVSNGSSVSAATPAYKSTYETPEERARKQVYIVRQSSITAALAYLAQTKVTDPSYLDVISVAQRFEAYVFGQEQAQIPTVE
jgi:hypothetical protein